MSIIPGNRPRLSASALLKMIEPYKVDLEKHKVIVVGIRGYYKNTMGVINQNDRAIYDDAIFIYSKDAMIAYNANTDPSFYRKGIGTGTRKGMASLKGNAIYYAHRLGMHKGNYLALVQRAGEVTVIRDGINGDYEDKGYFGINIHEGGLLTTSSEGCQTIPRGQYQGFITNVKEMLQRYYPTTSKTEIVPYILINN